MPSGDMNEFIRETVREELNNAAAPVMEILTRMQNAFALAAGLGAGTNTDSGRTPAMALSSTRRPDARRVPTSARSGQAGAFSPGDIVQVRVGRGTYEGTVVRIEPDSGSLIVRRTEKGDPVRRAPNMVQSVRAVGRPGPASSPSASASTGGRAKPSNGIASKADGKQKKKKLKALADRGDPSKFSKGQKVQFNLGHSMATGHVVGIDAKTATIEIARDGTQTKFKRPAVNVQPA